MAEWSDVAAKFIDLAKKKPKIAVAFALGAVFLGSAYLYHMRNGSDATSKPANSVQISGSKNQTAGQNDGTMTQDNK